MKTNASVEVPSLHCIHPTRIFTVTCLLYNSLLWKTNLKNPVLQSLLNHLRCFVVLFQEKETAVLFLALLSFIHLAFTFVSLNRSSFSHSPSILVLLSDQSLVFLSVTYFLSVHPSLRVIHLLINFPWKRG